MLQDIVIDLDQKFSKIVLEDLDKVKVYSHNAALYHVNLLAMGFKDSKVSLKGEECIQLVDSVINKEITGILNI